MFKKILTAISAHKIITAIVVIIVAVGTYYGYKSLKGDTSQTSYVLAAAEKGTLITSVSGSGQVSASNQVDIKTKASADITYLGVTIGQEVKTGTLLVQLDSQDAQKSVRDAQSNLDNAKLAMEKLQQPSDALSLLQTQNSLAQAQESKQKAQDELQKTYDDGFNTVSNAFLELPNVMAGLSDIILGNALSSGQQNLDYYADVVKIYDEKAIQYRDDAYNSYTLARAAYDKNFADYKSASRFSEAGVVESLIDESYDTTKDIAEAIKNINNLIQLYKDKLTEQNKKPLSFVDTHLSSLASYTQKTNSHLSSLLSIKNTIQNSKQSIISADRSIAEKTQSLADMQAGPDALDVRSQKLTIQQKEDALLEAKQSLADYSIYAPFDGVIVSVDVKKGDSVSAGTSIATLITKQRIAEISLNEVDAAEVKVGQKATLTFDAVEDLSISGQVIEMDALGTVSQGVVSYSATIGFDTQDDRIKPGMSVSAAIITDAKTDAILVPNSAVKISGDIHYVLTLDSTQTQPTDSGQGVISDVSPQQVEVEIGSSNDTSTQITSGLEEGDQVIIKTVTSSTTQTSSSSFNLFGIFGGNRNTQTSGSTKSSTSNTTNSSNSSSGSTSGSSSGGEMGPPPGF